MSFNFGNVSFRQGRSQQADLPLDVIGGVGTNLTNRYYTNRQAASKLKEQVLNLPDSNSEGNKKIIEKLSKDVKESFADYAKEDNWFDADNAVYDTMDKITSSQEVKDLYKYNAQYAKVDDEIEKSGAPEYYKQLRRAKNAMVSQKGIRGDNGESLSYQGRGLSGNLDVTGMYKQIEDLVDGWKADKETYLKNPQTFETMETSEGFKVWMNSHGKESIEKVDENEVRAFISNMVVNDPKFNAMVNDIAELDLFAKTGKIKPDESDITNILYDYSKSNPNLERQLIASSPSFVKETEGKKPKEINALYEKILNDPSIKESYLISGVEDVKRRTKNVFKGDDYSQAYTMLVRANMLTGLQSIASKVAYINHDIDMDFSESSLTGLMFKKQQNALASIPFTNVANQVPAQNVSDYLDIRGDLQSELAGYKARLATAKDPIVISQLNTAINSTESKMVGNDMMIDQIKRKLNLSDQDIIEANKDNTVGLIKSVLTGITNLDPENSFNPFRGFSGKYGTNAHKKDDIKVNTEIVYSIFKDNFKNNDKIKQELSAKNINLSDKDIDIISRSTERSYSESLNKFVKANKDNLTVSYPITAVGYYGANPELFNNISKVHQDRILRGEGNYNIVYSSNPKREGTTNNDMSMYSHKSKVKGNEEVVQNDITIDPVLFSSDKPEIAGKIAFKITSTDPSTGDKHFDIVTYNGPADETRDYYKYLAIEDAKVAVNPKNPLFASSKRAANLNAGFYFGQLPATHYNGKPVSGKTIMDVVANMENNGTASIDLGNSNYLSIQRIENRNGNNVIKVYNGLPSNNNLFNEVNKVFEIPNTSDPLEVIEILGLDAIQRQMNPSDRKGMEAINFLKTQR